MITDFHFSPRPNRAGEIAWQPWGEDAFARAQREDKPILLSISAVWCHWCHVMDETSYSDGGVIERINAHYVPVRVDNDERPDVNARYNMGGWPTTAFLTPDGTVLSGATYLPPENMQRALDEIASFYAQRKNDIVEKSREIRSRRTVYDVAPPDVLTRALVDEFATALLEGYDEEFGGFNEAPKFPQPEVHEFLLAYWRRSNDARIYELVAHTMRAMAHGGMYDAVEGGFFRYSTTRDWTIPHFEKMAEDHAGLLRVLAQLQLWAPGELVRDDLVKTIGYVRTVLRDPQTGFFAGSQDADEAYYALPLEERRARTAPFVDRRSYSNWTAALAGAFAWAGLALEDRTLVDEALATLDAMHERLRDEDGLLFHVAAPGEAPRIRGLLGDQVAYIRALLDAYEISSEPRMLERARTHADAAIAAFGAPDGGFYDRSNRDALALLELPDRPIVDNGVMAENLLRLASLLHEDRYRGLAQRTLLLYANTFARALTFSAAYVRALARYLAPEVAVRVTGELAAAAALRRAARQLPSPFVTVTSEPGSSVAAYLCVGTTCTAPLTRPAELVDAYAEFT
ncbi:MAG TPA: DUF255 domain-containing protein [Candidatus Baltobacteraceae bacterium]|nr:DUF255 domain-containing protein [Candidatus Baltobacteraceae bacterium]